MKQFSYSEKMTPEVTSGLVSVAIRFLNDGGSFRDENAYKQFLAQHVDTITIRGRTLREMQIEPANLNGEASEVLIRAKIDKAMHEWANHDMWKKEWHGETVDAGTYLLKKGLSAEEVAAHTTEMTESIVRHSHN